MEICIGRALMPFRPRTQATSHTLLISSNVLEYFCFQNGKPHQWQSFQYYAPQFSEFTSFLPVFFHIFYLQSANKEFLIDTKNMKRSFGHIVIYHSCAQAGLKTLLEE